MARLPLRGITLTFDPAGAPGQPRSSDASPPFPVDAAALRVLEALWAAGHAAYLVGGAVRDALLGRVSHDWDVATDALPSRILEVLPEARAENRFGTVIARDVEITTFRRDHHYADHRRPELVTFGSDLAEDLARRDFTVNAIAWGRPAGSRPGSAGSLVDPHGGRSDLAAGLLRTVGDPDARFEEDALRLMRAARIAAVTGLRIEPATHAAMAAHAADIEWVAAERRGIEVRRMLRAPKPSVGFRILHVAGILVHVLPELAALEGQAEAGHGGGDLLDHALQTLDQAAAPGSVQERLLFAALLHAVGQGVGVADAGARSTVDVGRMAATALERLRLPVREASEAGRLVRAHAGVPEVGPDDAAVRRFIRAVGTDLVEDALSLRRADDLASGRDPIVAGTDALAERVRRQLAAGVPLSLTDLAVDGNDLQRELARVPGPWLGELLEHLLERVIEDPARNTRDRLIAEARASGIASDEPASHAGGGRRRPATPRLL